MIVFEIQKSSRRCHNNLFHVITMETIIILKFEILVSMSPEQIYIFLEEGVNISRTSLKEQKLWLMKWYFWHAKGTKPSKMFIFLHGNSAKGTNQR